MKNKLFLDSELIPVFNIDLNKSQISHKNCQHKAKKIFHIRSLFYLSFWQSYFGKHIYNVC